MKLAGLSLRMKASKRILDDYEDVEDFYGWELS